MRYNSGGLFSVLLHLQPVESDLRNSLAQGRGTNYQAYAAFLNLLRQVDPVLSQYLHDKNARKPFTLSNLLENGQLSIGPIQPGRVYSLRLTCLDSDLFGVFIGRFLHFDQQSLTLRLGEITFKIVRIEGTTGIWSGHTSFKALYDKSSNTKDWQFDFASPTAFSQGEQDWGGRKFLVLPDPTYFFDSLANAWNCFAPPEVEQVELKELRDYVERYVVITQHAIQTAILPFKQHSQLGFTGRVIYRLMAPRGSNPTMTDWLNRLAALAFYSGVGYKTTMGLGQVRLIGPELTRPKLDAIPKVATSSLV